MTPLREIAGACGSLRVVRVVRVVYKCVVAFVWFRSGLCEDALGDVVLLPEERKVQDVGQDDHKEEKQPSHRAEGRRMG